MSYRYKIIIEYDGTNFFGWQKQYGRPSVQSVIEEAMYKFCQQHINVHGAGRTDAGVHALAHVAHFDLISPRDVHEIQCALNYHLRPHNISILACESVNVTFHARFSAVQRSYKYIIVNREAPLALFANKAWHVAKSLDHEKMHEAAQVLVGQHDFTSFRSRACQARSSVRTLDYIKISRIEDNIVTEIASRSFLHNQVRIIIGNLYEVGRGRYSMDDLKKILNAKDRTQAAQTAPSCGLYLLKITYPSSIV